MPKKNQISELQITSVNYIHDPDAAKKWMEIYINLLKEQIINHFSDEISIEE